MDRREIFNLGPADRLALDALVEARWNPAGVADALRPRAERILECADWLRHCCRGAGELGRGHSDGEHTDSRAFRMPRFWRGHGDLP